MGFLDKKLLLINIINHFEKDSLYCFNGIKSIISCYSEVIGRVDCGEL